MRMLLPRQSHIRAPSTRKRGFHDAELRLQVLANACKLAQQVHIAAILLITPLLAPIAARQERELLRLPGKRRGKMAW